MCDCPILSRSLLSTPQKHHMATYPSTKIPFITVYNNAWERSCRDSPILAFEYPLAAQLPLVTYFPCLELNGWIRGHHFSTAFTLFCSQKAVIPHLSHHHVHLSAIALLYFCHYITSVAGFAFSFSFLFFFPILSSLFLLNDLSFHLAVEFCFLVTQFHFLLSEIYVKNFFFFFCFTNKCLL